MPVVVCYVIADDALWHYGDGTHHGVDTTSGDGRGDYLYARNGTNSYEEMPDDDWEWPAILRGE